MYSLIKTLFFFKTKSKKMLDIPLYPSNEMQKCIYILNPSVHLQLIHIIFVVTL